MDQSEWRAEMLSSIERAKSALREYREALYDARRASDVLLEHADGEPMIQQWLNDTYKHPMQMQQVVNRLREVK